MEETHGTNAGEKVDKNLKVIRQISKGPCDEDEETTIFAVGPEGTLKSGSWKVGVKFFNHVLNAMLDFSRPVVWCQCGLR